MCVGVYIHTSLWARAATVKPIKANYFRAYVEITLIMTRKESVSCPCLTVAFILFIYANARGNFVCS